MNGETLRVLNVEDSKDDAELLLIELRRGGYIPDYLRVETEAEMRGALDGADWDVIIADYQLPEFSGPDALRVVKESELDIPFILVSGHIGDEKAVEVMRSGAHDYVLKNNLTRLVPSIQRELREARMRQERRSAQEELMRLSLAVKMSSDGISVHDLDGRILDSNEAFRKLCGIGPNDRLGEMTLYDLLSPEDTGRARAAIAELFETGSMARREYDLVRGNGNKVSIELSAALMNNGGDETVGFVSIGRDITERKRAEWQMRRSLMKFDLREGTVYLVKESSMGRSFQAFRDLVKVGYSGTLISRTPPENGSHGARTGFTSLWLSENGGEETIKPTPDHIVRWLREQSRKHVILVDRIDYLVSKNGTGSTVSLVQYLRELAYLGDHIVILSLDPDTLSERELLQLEKETSEMKPMEQPRLPDSLLQLLRFIYERNIRGEKPSYSEIGGELDTSKPTVRKRVRELLFKGLAVESSKGRTTVVGVTEKGRGMFTT